MQVRDVRCGKYVMQGKGKKISERKLKWNENEGVDIRVRRWYIKDND